MYKEPEIGLHRQGKCHKQKVFCSLFLLALGILQVSETVEIDPRIFCSSVLQRLFCELGLVVLLVVD